MKKIILYIICILFINCVCLAQDIEKDKAEKIKNYIACRIAYDRIKFLKLVVPNTFKLNDGLSTIQNPYIIKDFISHWDTTKIPNYRKDTILDFLNGCKDIDINSIRDSNGVKALINTIYNIKGKVTSTDRSKYIDLKKRAIAFFLNQGNIDTTKKNNDTLKKSRVQVDTSLVDVTCDTILISSLKNKILYLQNELKDRPTKVNFIISLVLNLIFIIIILYFVNNEFSLCENIKNIFYKIMRKEIENTGNDTSYDPIFIETIQSYSDDDNVFYMGLPTKDGFLDKDKLTTFRKGISVFKFWIDPNKKGKIAFFVAYNNEDIVDVLKKNWNDSNLRGFCKFNIPPSPDSNLLKTTRIGCAKIDSNRWAILYPTEIEFESKKENVQPEIITTPIPDPINKLPEYPNDLLPPPPPPAQNMQPVEFYMGMPDGNHFPGYAKSTIYKPGISMFKFQELRNNEAKFQMISDTETLKFIKNSVIDGLKPACIMSNLPSLNTGEIKTTKAGFVSFNGTNWEIKKQSEITFK